MNDRQTLHKLYHVKNPVDNLSKVKVESILKALNFNKKLTMNDRPNDLRRIRPEIKKTQQFSTMRSEERFQNETLRPILKFQNPLLVAVFHNYIEKRKGVFYDLGLEKKLAYIESSLIKDQKFRNSIKGMASAVSINKTKLRLPIA